MSEDSQNLDEELKIIVRKNVFYVSKKFICSSVPYFEKMFCSNLLESKENKVELDFDEEIFDIILNWIHSGLLILQMDNVIKCYNLADYLMIDETLLRPWYSYFHEKFTIKHLPIVLPQVTKVSKFMNSETIDYFICRHFLKIINTNVFLDYPVETVEYILKLDLMVYSEYQVFESIMKWVSKEYSREELLPQLLNCVRWSFMDPVDVTKIKGRLDGLIKGLSNLDSIISSDCEYGFNRTKQNFFVSLLKLANSKLRVNVFDNELSFFPIGDFTQDNTMTLDFFHEENISDILFDSRRKGIRIDWSKKTFRWLDSKVEEINYEKLHHIITQFFNLSVFHCYLEAPDSKPSSPIIIEESLLFESVDQYIVIGKTRDEKRWYGRFPALPIGWTNYDDKRTFHVTILDKVVYILTRQLQFIQFDCETKCFNKSEPFKDKKWNFNDLILTSHQTNDDKVILVNKSSGKFYVYLINQKKWIKKYRIKIVNFGSSNSNVNSNELIAFTSTFLQMKNIKPLYRRIFTSL
ncbi:uncharacterized protein LOC107361001 [Tetranychus urticae]|uniref:uncharacterized protein LOC107361001 n=1 Tax=Tetranychus urticae TaxID=32264 RepID=UPI000D6512DA|nr:uncharacterized protein LOC107361001 [Tetranychus urticae]